MYGFQGRAKPPGHGAARTAGSVEARFPIELPRFADRAEVAELGPEGVLVRLNKSDHFEVTESQDPVFFLEVSHWHDTSNALGLALGPQGVQVWRAMGGASAALYPGSESAHAVTGAERS